MFEKKSFRAAILSLVCFGMIFALPNALFAQPVQDQPLTKDDIAKLSPEEFDALLNSKQGVESLKAAIGTSTLAAEGDGGMPPGTVNCFDYYTFGSVQTEFAASVSNATAGTPVTFGGTLTNRNPYPIVQGKLIVKIFRVEGGQKNVQGPDVVDEFTAKDNVVIPANGSLPISFDWKIPAYAETGKYKAVTFFTVADKFNLLGLTFTDDIVGNSAGFSVLGNPGSEKTVMFDKDQVTINDREYYFAAFPPRIAQDADAAIVAKLANGTESAQDIQVKWKAYAWDAQGPGNLISEYEEKIHIDPKSSADVRYVVADKSHPVYYVVAEATYRDTKSIIGMRFVRGGIIRSRINFPSVLQYPLTKGSEATVFSCMHSMSDFPVMDGRLTLVLSDRYGKDFHSYEYRGKITGDMMGVKDSFIPEKNHNDFTLTTKLFQGDELVDSAVIDYDCRVLDPDNCSNAMMKVIIGTIVLLAIAIVGMFIKVMRKKRMNAKMNAAIKAGMDAPIGTPTNVSMNGKPSQSTGTNTSTGSGTGTGGGGTGKGTGTMMMLLLALGLAGSALLAPHQAFAKETQWNTVLKDKVDADLHLGTMTLKNINVTITYKVEITKENGELLTEGSSVPVGTKLKLKFIPHASDHVYWFGTGKTNDSPYGEWRENAAAPASVTCDEKDFINADVFGNLILSYFFAPLVINPPQKSIVNTQNLSCGTLANGEETCTVTSTGPISATFAYAATNGKFYFRNKQLQYAGGIPDIGQLGAYKCYGNNSPILSIPVPAQSITYGLTATETNNLPPTTPVISGNVTGKVGTTYSFGVISTDPDGDNVKYGLNWQNPLVVNSWTPNSGFVPQNSSQSINKSWTLPGTYVIQAMAEDQKGASSAWGTHTIVITNDDGNGDDGGDPGTIQGNSGTCTPGDANCANSCGSVPPVATGNTLTAGQCVPGVDYFGFEPSGPNGPNGPKSGWTWKCQAGWQSVPQVCTALCASGIYSAQQSKCTAVADDICLNLVGNQTNRNLYDIDSAGNCAPKTGAIKYFKFNPDVAEESCPAYWDVVLPDASLGFSASCLLDNLAAIAGPNGNLNVGYSNPLPGGSPLYRLQVRRLHSLTCPIKDDNKKVVKVLEASARCYKLGETNEI
jgi:hypothetical protein